MSRFCTFGFAAVLQCSGSSKIVCHVQGVQSPLAGQVVFRSVLFGAFGAAKRWLATNPDGSTRPLTTADFYKVRLIHSVCICI